MERDVINMINIYKSNVSTGKLDLVEIPEKGCWINMVKPTEDEIKKVASLIKIDEQTLRYPLDMAEKAHIDESDEDSTLLIVVDSPITETSKNEKLYTTLPIGLIFVRDDMFISISNANINAIDTILNKAKNNYVQTEKKSRFVFQILFEIAQDYVKYLNYISKDIEYFESHMIKSMKNSDLQKLMKFQKTMIYFNTSVKGNQVVLEKLSRGKSIKLYDEDEDILEDTMIENRQAMEMIQTYGEILNGIIDILGTMVSNNLNIVMKVLTSITVIISIPTLISSFLGMNVEFPFNTSIIGFYEVVVISVLVTAIVTIILKKRNML